jgi:Ca-activated chloride channel family protein
VRFHLLLLALLCSLFSLTWSVYAVGQTPISTGNDYRFLAPATTILKNVDEVNLAFTVTDKKGRFVGNLQSGDFQLLDNHKEPERFTYFQQKSDLPLHVAVLIDASASVQYRFRFEQKAASSFLKKILRPGTDKAFVAVFNDQVITVQDVTDNSNKLLKALKKVKAEGNTSLNDAIIFASEKLRRIPESQLTRRAIILISDGMDTVSRTTLQQAEEAAAKAEVMIFSLSTNYSGDDPNGNGDEVLSALAGSTGGALLPAHEETQLGSAFRSVEKALRNQYIVAYNPPEFLPDGSYRTVEVIPLKHGLRTNCRKGYYAMMRALR